VEWNKKFTLPFGCLVFFFIGAPLGAIIRKGGLGTPAVISILFFVIYYVISISGQKLVEEDVVGTFAGMWASSYILLPIGIFLTYKATTDSVIMNFDTYLSFLRKIKDYLYRITMNEMRKNSDSDKL
jgi:lipopolysaccharide export system permease protein